MKDIHGQKKTQNIFFKNIESCMCSVKSQLYYVYMSIETKIYTRKYKPFILEC